MQRERARGRLDRKRERRGMISNVGNSRIVPRERTRGEKQTVEQSEKEVGETDESDGDR